MSRIIQTYTILLPYFWCSKQARYATFGTLLLIALDTAAVTYFPYHWQRMISPSNHYQLSSWFMLHGILLFSLWFFIRNSIHLREMIFFPVTNRAIKEIRLKTISKVHSICLKDLEKHNIQEIISATGRISQSVRGFMRASFIAVFPSTAKIISLSIALFTVDKICWGIISAACLGLMVSIMLLNGYTNAKKKAWELTDLVTTGMAQSLYRTKCIRFRPADNDAQLKRLFDAEANAWQRYNIYFYALHLVQDGIFYAGAGIVFCLLLANYSQGNITLETLILIYGLIASMHNPLLTLTNNLKGFFGGMVDLHKTLAIFNIPSEYQPYLLTTLEPQPIFLRQVAFHYYPDRALLKNINLTINPGDKIGIFGPSGAGKSTLCQLIAGLLAPTAGEVCYDKAPIAAINKVSLGKVLYYLPQMNWMEEWKLTSDSENLQIRRKMFSGGEYQQYMLEQALSYQPQFLVLDETFNALDEATAMLFLETVFEKVSTVILVSHSKPLLAKMEHLFSLNDGYLVPASLSIFDRTIIDHSGIVK